MYWNRCALAARRLRPCSALPSTQPDWFIVEGQSLRGPPDAAVSGAERSAALGNPPGHQSIFYFAAELLATALPMPHSDCRSAERFAEAAFREIHLSALLDQHDYKSCFKIF